MGLSMPLPPLPPNNTPVIFVHYSYQDQAHTMQMRIAGDFSFEDGMDKLEAFINLMMPIADNSWAVTGVDFRPQGSIIALPVTPIVNTPATGGVLVPRLLPRESRFIGRGQLTGRRTSISIYGVAFPENPNFRITSAENAVVGNCVNALNAASNDAGVTVAGDTALWYPYVNLNYNSHWETAARG